MVEQVVEQKTTDMWVLQGMAATVAEESRRQWTSRSMEQRRKLTNPVGKKAGN
jgi:hypothetical protein